MDQAISRIAAAAAARPAAPNPDGATRRPVVDMLLGAGGDERIAIDPATRRNRYGTPRGAAPDEIWLSSSTASAISRRGHAAASIALSAIMGQPARTALPDWFENLRARLVALYGTPGTQAILSASGTEAEMLALALAGSRLPGPLTNIVIAPQETGSGVALAAGGRHFLDSAPFAAAAPRRGVRLAGWETRDIAVVTVDIRDSEGNLLPAATVDAAATAAVEAATANGRGVLLHVLDCSKTGHSGVQRPTAAALAQRFAGRLQVVVDACQLRCPPERIRADLAAGFLVMITGSKFAGGPPFAGALLLPPGFAPEAGQPVAQPLPAGLAVHLARHDWPAGLAGLLPEPCGALANLGLGLRWEAALAELEALAALGSPFGQRIARHFGALARDQIAAAPGLAGIDRDVPHRDDAAPTIFPILTLGRDGAPLPAEPLHRALQDPARTPSGRIFHLGQPVPVGPHKALRLCLSAVQIVDIGTAILAGQSLERAFAPLAQDLADLFAAWAALRRHAVGPGD